MSNIRIPNEQNTQTARQIGVFMHTSVVLARKILPILAKTAMITKTCVANCSLCMQKPVLLLCGEFRDTITKDRLAIPCWHWQIDIFTPSKYGSDIHSVYTPEVCAASKMEEREQ